MKNVNMKELLEKYENIYETIYAARDNVPGFDEAVDSFCLFLNSNFELVCAFDKCRGDVISSDREAAAFMFALKEIKAA